MNYNEFIKAVDKKLATMDEREKEKWIHNLARTIQENERCKFLNSLNGENNCGEIIYDIKEIQEWCEKIQNGDIYFECSYCEVYGENYWRDYSYEYYDTYEIGKKLTFAFQVAEDLLYQKKYEKASVLYNLLIDMVFQAYDSDSEEIMELGIEELVDENLVSLNLKKIVLNLLYAKYQTSNGEERVQAIYSYIKLNISRDIKLEEFFTIGTEELVGIGVFLEEWIAFLKCEDGDLAGNLLFEACMLQGDIEMLCDTAREMVQKHPVLYLRACEYLIDERKDTECEKIGLEAISLLNEELNIRGKVADLTAKAAKELGHTEVVWKCYKAAFHSESTLNHYLRLFEAENYENITDINTMKLRILPEKSFIDFNNINNQMKINNISLEHKKILRFFNGEFDYIYEECKKDKTYLGWSNNSKGIFVPLFILYLGQSHSLSKAGEKLIEGLKCRLNYSNDDDKNLVERFFIWKDKIKITSEQYEKYITWLHSEVDKRTDAVVGGGFRGSYYKAAVLISALGETMESHGNIGTKINIIENYKKIYSKKRAFKAEFEVLK
ncbi:hypothetical protein BD780_000822 [Clostridium tetanomorphum]|uniref:hypothetical protein n=1 Tax=Clostridium tetanomorphum TaxID=1553 RepID=UPI000448C2A3|nr:hypothetical protein [Clostridium tetanomorphum]KAJ50003.1 hypothetical protein CTM_20291 [Clostridium tetanomorphum DSM 665]MBP1863499.1 hypothetical protein [Clostridium tetanomorphum]NRS83597.1 hypothetical protein [Clostridium tetanomorphum]SQC01973.1 Uncharacterised protein [Clostridium tetanomorphum]